MLRYIPEPVFDAEVVGDLTGGERGVFEVSELFRAVHRGRVHHYMRVKMLAIQMGAADEGVISMRQCTVIPEYSRWIRSAGRWPRPFLNT